MNPLISHKLNSLGTPAAFLSYSVSSFFLLYYSGRAVRPHIPVKKMWLSIQEAKLSMVTYI